MFEENQASPSHVSSKAVAVGRAATHRAATQFEQLAAVGVTREARLMPPEFGGSSSSNVDMAVSGNEPPTVEGTDVMVGDDEIDLAHSNLRHLTGPEGQGRSSTNTE